MLWFLQAIPVVGKAIDAIGAYYNKKQDVDLEKYKVKGVVDVEAMRQDTAIIQARADLAKARADDPVDRWGRRLFIYPTGVWFSLIVYDSAFRNLLPDEWTWRVLALPDQLNYIPYAVIVYLFAVVVKNSMVK